MRCVAVTYSTRVCYPVGTKGLKSRSWGRAGDRRCWVTSCLGWCEWVMKGLAETHPDQWRIWKDKGDPQGLNS